MTGIKGVLIKKILFSPTVTPAVSQEGILQRMSGWGWMHGYTDGENTVILQGRHGQKRDSESKERKWENKENTDWTPLQVAVCCIVAHTLSSPASAQKIP